MSELMTLEEVADYLRVTKKTVYRLVNDCKIPATKVGRLYRFDKSAVDDWLRENSVSNKVNILVIDDDNSICSLFKDALEAEGHEVKTANTAAQGLNLVKDGDFDIVFLDLKMPEMDGADVFKQIRLINPDLPVTIITGYRDSELMAKVLEHGPFGVMGKPFSGSDIISAVNSYLHIVLTNK